MGSPVPKAVLAAAMLCAAVLLSLGFSGPRPYDIEMYYDYASSFFSGAGSGLYSSLHPPFALAYFLVPYVLSSGQDGYFARLVFLNLLLFSATFCLVYVFAKRRGLDTKAAALKYVLFAAALANLFIWHYDLLPALFALAAVLLFSGGRRSVGFFFLLLGGGVKFFPLLLLPLFFLAYRKSGLKHLGRDFAPPAAAASLLYVLAVRVFSFGSGLDGSLFVNLSRHFQIETVCSSVVLAVGALFPALRPSVETFLSVDVRFPLEQAFLWVSFVLTASLLLFLYRSAMLSGRKLESEMPAWSALVLLAFLLTTNVFSPQYLLWLAPFLPFALPNDRGFFALSLSAFLLTSFIYLHLYGGLIAQEPVAVAALLLRNILLVAMFVRLFLTRKAISS